MNMPELVLDEADKSKIDIKIEDGVINKEQANQIINGIDTIANNIPEAKPAVVEPKVPTAFDKFNEETKEMDAWVRSEYQKEFGIPPGPQVILNRYALFLLLRQFRTSLLVNFQGGAISADLAEKIVTVINNNTYA